jgi:outer membrane receptor protein involved in Fe transport
VNQSDKHYIPLIPWFAGWFLLAAGSVGASEVDPNAGQSLVDLSLNDLLNVTITSVSRQEEILSDAAAAVFVLSNDDLRRSGATTVADALRLVPGLQVAAIGSSDWAISARGFNHQFANKLLVMIDGRTVYSPLFSGVYWDIQQVFLEDVDRIEVIRGPGATVWGANAVNGVINILSKNAQDTQGTLLYGGGGDLHRVLGGARYGGMVDDNTYYRVHGSYQLTYDYQEANGTSAHDRWDLGQAGFHLDYLIQAIDAESTELFAHYIGWAIMSQLYPYVFDGEKTHGTLVVDGWHTHYLGANVPTPSVIQTVVERQAAVLAISATITYHVRAVEALIVAVRRAPGCAEVKILVGGYPFKIVPELWRELGADGSAPDAQGAILLANRFASQPLAS